MNNKIKEIKSIIDEVFNKYKKSIKKLRLELYPNYKFPSYPVWKLDDENKIIKEIISNIIEKFPELKSKEKNIYAGLKARFLLTKQEWPAKDYITLDGAFDEPLSAIEEFYNENVYEKYLNLIIESKNKNWKTQIINILDSELLKSENLEFDKDHSDENEEIREITNTRIIIMYENSDGESLVEIPFSVIEKAIKHPQGNWIELEVKLKNKIDTLTEWVKFLPLNKAQEIIKIWKFRK
jgi:hypothetical protein